MKPPEVKTRIPSSGEKSSSKVLKKVKQVLAHEPARGLPDVGQPFSLFVDERRGIAKGVLTQN